jgi:hypothetical protein
MKSFFVLFAFLSLFSFSAHADWGGGRPGWGGNRNVSCRSYDNGWEEHWGGHATCQECKAKHGGCTEICTATSYKCTAEGSDAQGAKQTFEAYGDDEWRARDEATRRCYDRGLNNCSVSNCDTSNQEVSRKGC